MGYLASVLRNKGVNVTIACQDVFHWSNEKLAEKYLKKESYDFIGLGFLAARFTETVLPLCDTINKYKKDALFVLGGHGPSPIPEYMLKKTNCDTVIVGECENNIFDIINNKQTGIVKGKSVKNLDSLPFPAWDLFPMKEYTKCMFCFGMKKGDKALAILTTRGCINQCTFCYRMEKGIRLRSIPNVGFESSCQKVLDSMNKNATVEQNMKVLKISKKIGFPVGLNFIWGFLDDDEKTLKDNAELIKRYHHYIQVRTIRPVTPYPGSQMYYDAIEKGLLDGPDDFFNKFKNSDLMAVNFTKYSNEQCYKWLFEVNKDLVLHYYHNNGSSLEAQELINGFYKLYFNQDYKFRGAR